MFAICHWFCSLALMVAADNAAAKQRRISAQSLPAWPQDE
jgi:hypothetical protein